MTNSNHRYQKFTPKKPGNTKRDWLWLGTWSLAGEGYGRSDGRESLKVLEKALDWGITHFDTAGFYGSGKSELLIKKALGSKRESIFISTKGGLRWEGKKVFHDGSQKELKDACYKSLERLNTDYIDLYQLHWPDPETPISCSIETLKDLKKEGVIRNYGVCNLSEDEIDAYIKHNELIAHQVHFNPLHLESHVLETGYNKNRTFNIIISPLEQGLLGSSHSQMGISKIGKKDVRRRNPHFLSKEDAIWLEKLDLLLKEFPIPKVIVTLLWILSHSYVDCVCPGPRNILQLKDILEIDRWIIELNLKKERSTWEDTLRDYMGQSLWNHLSRMGV